MTRDAHGRLMRASRLRRWEHRAVRRLPLPGERRRGFAEGAAVGAVALAGLLGLLAALGVLR